MPPKGDATKNRGGSGNGKGPGTENAEGSVGGSGPDARTGGGTVAVPLNSDNGMALGQQRADATSSAGGTPMEVDSSTSVKEKLMQATQEVVEKVQGLEAQAAMTMSRSWGTARKQMQPRLNQCLVQLVEAVPEDFEPDPIREVVRPGVRAVAFRDLVENASADIVGSIDELMQWVLMNLHDPAAINSLVSRKQEAYTKIYDTVLSQMSGAILDRMHEARSTHMEFGRDSDYGQAMEGQQTLAKERDELEHQLAGFQKHVEDLKSSEADLYARCTELQDKFSVAQKDLSSSRDKVGILEAVTDFLDTDPNNAVSKLVQIKDKHRKFVDTIHQLEAKISELESHECPTEFSVSQDDSERIKDLDAQLQAAKDANVKLHIVADQQKRIPSGSGARQPLVERARAIGFVFDSSGKLQIAPPPPQSQVFDISKPYCYSSRNQSVPAPPPLKVFLGEYKEDKMGLSEFLRMYKHRYGPCTEDTKVEMLGEYLAGEAKRVYRSILSSCDCASIITFDELESRMKNLMLDNSRTGMLLKQQRVHGLRMKDEESYLSFVTFFETKVCEAYDDAGFDIIDGVKIQVVMKNIRDPVLALQVEQALRDVPMGSPLFPKAKDLVIAYERTAKQARQWTGNAGSGSNHNNGKGSGRDKFHGNPSAQGKSEVKSSGTDIGAAASAGGSNGGAPPRSVPVCFKCHKPGHRMAECSGGGAPHLTGGNAVAAKFGSSGPLKCHEYGELGHIRPRCPKLSRGNFARASGTTNSGSAPAAVEPPKPSDSDSFLSMRMSQTTEELLSGVVGGQCVASIWLNGIESKALWNTGSQVNIISKLHLQNILRKSPERLRKAKCLTVHPPGINIKDASGKEMPFLGLVQLEIKANDSDPVELRKFLVQDGPTNFDVVLGTTAILGGSRLCDNFVKLMRSWNGTVRPCDSKDASSNGYCMRVAVESNEWSEVTVARSCYVRPGSQKTVRLSCGLKDAKAFLVGEGVSFCDVDTNGQLCATVANEGQDTLCLMKGKKIAKCVNAENVSLEDVEQAVEAAGHAMLASLNGDAAKRAAEIYERVLEGSQGKSVLSENRDKMVLLFERFNDCFALSDF